MVLRIQRSQKGDAVVLVISGTLADEYLAELGKAVDAEVGDGRLALDLTDVTHVSREAVRLLGRLEERGARLVGCPEYLRDWISKERD